MIIRSGGVVNSIKGEFALHCARKDTHHLIIASHRNVYGVCMIHI